MKFVTHKISTGKAKSFDEIIRQYQEKTTVKTASTKVAAEVDEAESSGQLSVEPLHQTGESTTMPAAGPSAKKDDNSNSSGKAAGKEDEEGEDSGQPKAEAKLTNDPKPDKDAATEAKVETKEAKKALPDALKEHQFKAKDDTGDEDEDEDEDEEKISSVKEAGENAPEKRDGTGPYKKSRQTGPYKKSRQKDETGDKGKRQLDGEECPKCEEEKEAKAQPKFVRLANLDDKSKSWLGDYWKKLYPADYVDAMLADK